MLVSFTNHHLLTGHHGLYGDAHQRVLPRMVTCCAPAAAPSCITKLCEDNRERHQGGAQDLCTVRNIGVE